jgi:hypothetical protein
MNSETLMAGGTALAKAAAAPMTFGQHAGRELLGFGLGVARDLLRERHAQQLALKNAPAAVNPIRGLLTNAGALAAGTGAVMAVGAAVDSYQIDQSYKKMLTLYPELAREDPNKVKNIFDAVTAGSPDLAKQPVIVGSLVRRMLNFDGFDHTTFNDLVSAQSSINKSRSGAAQQIIGVGTAGLNIMHNYGINAPPRR